VEIIELKTELELKESFSVMKELRTHLNEKEYLNLLAQMIPEGYRLFALREAGKLVSLAGVAVFTNLYFGRHVWVYDLVTTERERSKGHGKKILDYLEDFANKQGCNGIALSSGLHRIEAHNFYQNKMEYNKTGFVFQKT